MIVPVAALAALLLPAVLGGRLSRLAGLQLRRSGFIVLVLVAQTLAVEDVLPTTWLPELVHVASYPAAAVFLWANRHVPGLLAAGVGAASNGVTIALNGGTLPASPQALARAGLADASGSFANSGVVQSPRLAFLGDVFAVPAGWPLHNVFSIGDVVLVLAVGWFSLRICGTRWSRPWHRPRHAAPARARAGAPKTALP